MGYSPMQHMSWLGSGYQRVGNSAAEALVLPAGTKAVMVVALVGNSGQVYVGDSNVTVPSAGTDDQTSGIQLDNGQQSPWIPVPALPGATAGLYIIGSAADQDVTFIAVG